MKKVTIKDVALKANVSVTSVSFIFNGKDYKVSKETKDLVLKVAEELGYHPDNNARSLRTHKSNTVGFICPDICNGYYSTIAKKLEDRFNEHNLTLIIGNSAYTIKKEINYIKEFAARRVDFLIIIPCADTLKSAKNQALLEKTLKENGLPYIVLDRRTNFDNHFEISNDDIYGGKIATSYLIEKGYKRIACITGPSNVSSSIDRLKGYMEALAEHNLKFDSSLIKEGNYSNESGVKCTKELLDEKLDFDAVFAFNDLMAYGVYQVFGENNISIPSEKAVIGCDDLYFSSLISPNLTTIKPDLDKMVDLIATHIFSGDINNHSIQIKPSLVVRSSVRGRKNG